MEKKSGNKVILYILIGIIILVGIGVGTLALMFPPQKIKAMVLPQVTKALGRNVEVDRAGISIYPVIGVSLTGLKIDNTSREGFSDTAFVKIDKFLIQISFISLLKGKPEISRIILKNPFILVETDKAGSFNYSDLAILKSDSTVKKEEKKSGALPMLPVPLSMKSFVIEHGVVQYIDRKGKMELLVGNIDQQISFSIDKQLKDIHTSGSLVLSNVSVKEKSISKPLTNLTITLLHDIGADLVSGTAEVHQIRLSFQKLFLNCSGTIADLNGTPEYNLNIASDPVELKDLLAEIPLELAPDLAKIAASGILDLKLAINGRFDNPKHLPVQGSLVVKDGSIKYTDLPKSINAFNVSVLFNDSMVNVEQLRCKLGENPIALRAMVSNFSKPLLDLDLKARVNLGDLKDMMVLPQGAAVSGLVNADIAAHGYIDPADPSKIDVKGTTALENVSVLWPPIVQPAVINGLFTLSSKAIGENMTVTIGSSSLKMSASISNYLSLLLPDSTKRHPRPVADFALTSPMLNVDEFMPPSKEPQSGSRTAEKPAQQPVPLIAPLPGVDMTGKISATKLIYTGIHMDNLLLNLRVINDIADVDIKTGFSKGTIAEQIHADLRNVNDISFTNNLKVSNVQVAELIGKFGNFIEPTTPLNRELINLEKSLSGSLNLTSNMSGHGGTSDEITRTLNGMIGVNITDGRIANSLIMKRLAGVIEKFTSVDDITFRDLKATLQVENQRVTFKQCTITAGEMGDWDILGDVGFDASLAMKINTRLSKNVSQKALQLQNAGKGALKGLLGGTSLGAMGNSLIDNAGIPSDKEGRITLRLGLGGSATDPKPQFLGFGEGSSSSATASPQAQLKDKAKEMLDQKKAELDKKLQEERQKAEALAQQKLDEERRNAEALLKKKLEEQKLADEANKVIQNENVKKQSEDLKKKAGSALKKLF